MAILFRCRTCHPKVRAPARESEPDQEQASAWDLDQALDQARMETWALATSRSVAAVPAVRSVMVVQTMTAPRVDLGVEERFSERVSYPSRNRSTPRTRVETRSPERLCCALCLRAQAKSCRYMPCVRCRLG